MRRLRVALQVGSDLPEDLAEWLGSGLDAFLTGDASTLDGALGLERLRVDPRSVEGQRLRPVRDDEIRRLAALMPGTASATADELARLVRDYESTPDPRLQRLMTMGVDVPGDCRQLRRIIMNTYW